MNRFSLQNQTIINMTNIIQMLTMLPATFLISLLLNMWFQVALAGCLSIVALVFYRKKVSELTDRIRDLDRRLVERAVLLQYAKENEKKAKDEIVLKESEYTSVLTQLSRNMRTPMNGVLGMTTLMESTPLTTEQNEYVQS